MMSQSAELEPQDELQELLERCWERQQARRRIEEQASMDATCFAWVFTFVGLIAAAVMYVVKFFHWWGVR